MIFPTEIKDMERRVEECKSVKVSEKTYFVYWYEQDVANLLARLAELEEERNIALWKLKTSSPS